MKKRGQFTILVIFGLLAIIVVGLVFFMRSLTVKEIAEVSTEEALSDFLKANKVHTYVESCLQAVSEEAVKLVTLQGGKIWSHQGGAINMEGKDVDGKLVSTFGNVYLPVEVNEEIYNVSYVLDTTSSANCFNLYNNSIPPNYPYPNLTINDMNNYTILRQTCSGDRDAGFFGKKELQILCQVRGPNWKGDVNRPSVYSSCQGKYGYEREFPVQFQLANYTENNIAKCGDFSDLENIEGFEIKILNKPEVEYVFGRDDISVNATYPVTVTVQGKPPVSKKISFYRRINADLKETYEFFGDLLLREVRNSSFDPGVHYATSSMFKPGLKAKYVRNFCLGCENNWIPSAYDDLLVVENQRSTILGEPMIIMGIIKNKAPILEPVPKIFNVPFPDKVNEMLSESFDVVAFNNTNLEINPYAIDSENDIINFTYLGWLGNYSEEKKQTCRGVMEDAVGYAKNPTIPRLDTLREKFENMNIECGEHKKREPLDLNNWHASVLYKNTNMSAKVKIPKTAFGVYTTRLITSDGASQDYQDIKILVIPTDVYDE